MTLQCLKINNLAVIQIIDNPRYVALVEIGAYVSYCGSKWQGSEVWGMMTYQ